jgi:hypothetical protein
MRKPKPYLAVLALAMLFSGAAAAAPQVQCQNEIVDGVTVCAVNIVSYATNPANGQPVCPSGVTSTGSALICQESLAAAVSDAAAYLKHTPSGPQTYYVGIDRGTYDFSNETEPLPGKMGAIDVRHLAPAGNGCPTPAAAHHGTVALSGSGCLVIAGSSWSATTLIVPNGLSTIHGAGVSHLLVANMTIRQPLDAITQGTFVATGEHTLKGIGFQSLTVDMSPGFPTPLDLFVLNCHGSSQQGCTKTGISSANNNLYMRAYTNTAAPQLIMSVSKLDSNGQLAHGFPTYRRVRLIASAPIRPDPINYPNRWEITLSVPMAARAVPSAYSGTTGGVANLICFKYDHGQAFWFDGGGAGSTDIILSGLRWIGASRGSFRRVTASAASGTPGGQFYNSSISRAPPINGQAPCLSNQSGGMQFGQPGDPPIFGSIVDGQDAQASGDDTIAMFNDVGGQPNGNGGIYPRSVVRMPALGNSFSRHIYLFNDKKFSHLAGKSSVLVDAVTKRYINRFSNRDRIVAGRRNCAGLLSF